MTDSMKFGPEWLRNMSSDNSSSGFSSCNSGQNGSGGSGVGSGSVSGNIQVSFSGNTIRGQFPEFRYGREEMLSLFDRNCIIPEILPSFKKLFVEKVQYPLALTPSSEEEMLLQSSQASTQRPAWIRSPVGFNSSASRGGTGRGGSVDRGRLRGKSTYHSVYQRPTPVFDDETRTGSIKSERGWSERNGITESLSVTNSSSGVVGPEWNGTPSSSPRKDFSNHSRNLENWRKNRTEDGSGDVPNNNYTTAEGGWRNAGRWVRSTSWRDEDNCNNESNNGGPNIIQRSLSTIATTVTDRGNGYNNSYSRSTNQNAGSISQPQVRVVNRSHWNSTNNNSVGRNIDGDDNLPEWAVENPSAEGGTFDSSGAFHGSIDRDESLLETSSKDEEELEENSIGEIVQKNETDCGIIETGSDNEHTDSNDGEKSIEPIIQTCDDECNEVQNDQGDGIVIDEVHATKSEESTIYTNENSKINSQSSTTFNDPLPNDYSDRMREVADDMIEKLIMEDDTTEKTVAIIGTTAELNTNLQQQFSSPIIASILTQANQNVNTSNAVAVSPTLPTAVSGHNSSSLYGSLSSAIIDNTHLQQLELQHQHLPSSTITSTSTTSSIHQNINSNETPSGSSEQNLWFYRDPQSKVQGPFTAIEMTEWYRAGYFNENLFVRRVCDTRFRTLGDLIKLCNGNMPFTHSHLIPMCLDDLHISQIREKPQILDDFILKQQQQHIDEISNGELKDNVNSAGSAMNPHLQLMQDQYIHQEEHKIFTELSKNDFFKQLNSQDRDLLVREKLCARFPNILTNLSGLTNSLENMNVIPPGHNLYDSIGELTKRDHGIFRVLTPQQQQQNQCPPPTGNSNYMDSNNFMMQTLQQQVQQHQQQIHQPITPVTATFVENMISGITNKNISTEKMSNDVDSKILNEFNMRLLLRQQQQQQQQHHHQQKPQEFLNNVNVNEFLQTEQITQHQQPQQHPIMQMWMPHMGNTAGNANGNGVSGNGGGNVSGNGNTLNLNQNQILNQKHQQHHTHLQQQQDLSNQWAGGTLVGIMPSSPIVMGNLPVQPATIWDCSTLEQVQSQQQQQQIHLKQLEQQQQRHLNHEHENLKENHSQIVKQQQQSDEEQDDNLKLLHVVNSDEAEKTMEIELQNSLQYQSPNTPILETSLTKQRKDDQHMEIKQQISINKRNSNNNNNNNTNNNNHGKQISAIMKSKNDDVSSYKRVDDDRRRDGVEEKRRLKEEKKRQLVEEEKRRIQQIEDEKRRQMLEEKERQQQIQAQRRRALMSNDSPTSAITTQTIITTSSSSSTLIHKQQQQQNKDTQRMFSSIAPWSIHNNASVNQTGPSLAEIQKAERRERRADQQRQIEMMEKQMRANIANNESNDTISTWNASPLPVKSFAEIQAEEAKRLANQQLELQRRKDQDLLTLTTNNNISGNSTAGGSIGGSNGVSNSANLSNIWGTNKVWSSTTTAGFWEEPIKFNNSLTTNAAKQKTANNTSNLGSVSSTQLVSSSANRSNLKKSQTVSVMQKGGNSTIQQLQLAAPLNITKNNTKVVAQVKNKNNTSIASSTNKKDELENEFTMWCIRSLNHVTDKVDIPTFVSFLRDLESPYEVKDYIRYYLGENKEFADFGKQFLEKRSRYKNLQRAQNAHNDDMCKPAPAITPTSLNDDNKGKQRKLKKSKMTKLDARILGFSVTAAEGRINVGDRDYVDAP